MKNFIMGALICASTVVYAQEKEVWMKVSGNEETTNVAFDNNSVEKIGNTRRVNIAADFKNSPEFIEGKFAIGMIMQTVLDCSSNLFATTQIITKYADGDINVVSINDLIWDVIPEGSNVYLVKNIICAF